MEVFLRRYNGNCDRSRPACFYRSMSWGTRLEARARRAVSLSMGGKRLLCAALFVAQLSEKKALLMIEQHLSGVVRKRRNQTRFQIISIRRLSEQFLGRAKVISHL